MNEAHLSQAAASQVTTSQATASQAMASEFDAIIEIPAMSSVKYEIDKTTHRLVVDRLLEPAMYYPCNYGFIPETLGGDGDPLDVLVITPNPLIPLSCLSIRPIGMLRMTDEGGDDAKILAVPGNRVTSLYQEIQSTADLSQGLLRGIRHFFEHYKDLDTGKWVELKEGWANVDAAYAEILASIHRYRDSDHQLK